MIQNFTTMGSYHFTQPVNAFDLCSVGFLVQDDPAHFAWGCVTQLHVVLLCVGTQNPQIHPTKQRLAYALVFAFLPVCALPLVEWCSASWAVLLTMLAAYPRGAGHVVVGHRRRLHRFQGLVGCVAPAGITNNDKSRAELQIPLSDLWGGVHQSVVNPISLHSWMPCAAQGTRVLHSFPLELISD